MPIKRVIEGSYKKILNKVEESHFVRKLSRSFIVKMIKEKGIVILYIITLIALSSGIINVVLEGGRAGVYRAILATTTSVQSPTETVINILTLILGTAGVYLIYQSGRQIRPRLANFYLLAGILIIVLALIMGLYIIAAKR
jgi:hypothetical protein